MPPGQLGKGVFMPAEDFGYQFLVGFVAQTLPRPSKRRATQHNCLLIRTDSTTVTDFRRIYAPLVITLETILYVFWTVFRLRPPKAINSCGGRRPARDI